MIDSLLGSVWFLLGPILEMLVYFFLVVVVFDRVRFDDVPAFLGILIGIAHYRVFQMTVSQSITSIVANRNIMLQIRVEPMVFVAVAVAKQLQEARYYAFLIVVGLGAYLYLPPIQVVLYPAVLLLILLAIWSSALMLSCLYVYVRDLQPMAQMGFRLFLYGSPIIYPLTLIPDEFKTWYFVNPLAGVFGSVQATLLGIESPPLWAIIWSVTFFTSIAFMAHYFYQRNAPNFTKIL